MRYRLCREFHWTPQELDDAPAQDVEDFVLIMGYVEKLGPGEAEQ